MEDTATAEISRAQLWQWIRVPEGYLADGRKVTVDLCRSIVAEEMANIEGLVGKERLDSGKFELASQLLDQLISADEFIDFLTLVAYDYLE